MNEILEGNVSLDTSPALEKRIEELEEKVERLEERVTNLTRQRILRERRYR